MPDPPCPAADPQRRAANPSAHRFRVLARALGVVWIAFGLLIAYRLTRYFVADVGIVVVVVTLSVVWFVLGVQAFRGRRPAVYLGFGLSSIWLVVQAGSGGGWDRFPPVASILLATLVLRAAGRARAAARELRETPSGADPAPRSC
jgi:hypothetical protein